LRSDKGRRSRKARRALA